MEFIDYAYTESDHNKKKLNTELLCKKYKKINDSLKIGSARLNSLEYWFFKNKFVCNFITVNGYDNYIKLRDACFASFGRTTVRYYRGKDIDEKGIFGDANSNKIFMELYEWDGDITRTLLDCNYLVEVAFYL